MPLDTGLSITPGRVVGQPIDRRDGRLKVTGRARYAAEFDIDNLAHAVLVQSTIASGEVIGFNLADAQAVPGVLTIMTPDNAPRLPQAGSGQSETAGPLVAKPLLQDRLVLLQRPAHRARGRRHAGAGATGRGARARAIPRSRGADPDAGCAR
jgi:CO/xanthine dehydrogenase Mo-binding subunit